jgi:hypothetical protein
MLGNVLTWSSCSRTAADRALYASAKLTRDWHSSYGSSSQRVMKRLLEAYLETCLEADIAM